MFYHLFKYFDEAYDLPGSGMFQYISFRSAAAIILALLIAIIFGRRIIDFLRRKQIGEEIRDLGLEGQLQKRGTPTMGGVIILLSILLPTLLFARLDNIYIQLLLVSTVWLGLIGGLDDYIKVFRHHKEGLKGRFKIVGQVGLGLIVGTTMWLSPDIVVREEVACSDEATEVVTEDFKTTQTTIPFVKNNELDYGWFTGGNETAAWVLYVLVAILVVTAVSNGANLTDGLDGLVTGVSVPIVMVLGILAYLSGHLVYADYLNIMYIPNSGELVIFAAALMGALVGFLWYNSFPAQIFMGDTGSLSIGGVIAVFALCIRKELLLPLLCGIFLIESCSVMMQVAYFKWTKRRYGEGRRIFLMTPIHHHYQKRNIFETKIVLRFWIISLLLAAVTLVTLKIR
ncbi:MAG: phospho-N-acetylmuramoyl-pentapeptide-transferase [Alistipes sp.]|nr:phospho-N-acetylmuramoyl-pentapeptide-transferase [Rikenellaceae bacterium]MBQ6882201.1 phospho-N-acetylmuramoyl-pentapeptide-transferase [Alistipes sp.]